MKQFIVLAAVLPIMLLFLAQFALDQMNDTKISLAGDVVHAAKEQAKQNGGFDVESLRSELAEKLKVDESLIIIEASPAGSVPRILENGERGIINYYVKFPVGSVMTGKSFFGIKDNKTYGYVIESCAPSEYLP